MWTSEAASSEWLPVRFWFSPFLGRQHQPLQILASKEEPFGAESLKPIQEKA
jgi:hypothetical protein